MKTFIFDYDRGFFVNTAGGVVACTPTLVYGEQAEWRLLLKTATGTVYPVGGLVELTAAVGFGGQTLAATTYGIAVDVEAGSITIPIDCLTQEFYAATAGKPNGIYGFFELSGYDAAQQKILYLRFNVLASEIALPDVYSIPGLPERIIAVVSSGGYVNSSGARAIADEAAAIATSGAIIENRPFSTTVGGYTVELTSGGLAVSGSGASVVFSGGQITANAGSASALLTADQDGVISMGNGHAGIQLGGGDYDVIAMSAGAQVEIDGGLTKNGADVATEPWADSRFTRQLVASTDEIETSAAIPVLSGGMSYLYTLPLYSVEVSSVVKTTDASYLHFALDSVTAPTPVVISGVSRLDSTTFEGGKEYLVGFFDGMAVVNEVTQ